jgi:hypothetical protein
MSFNTYFELKEEIVELQDALDNETNEDTRLEITRHISAVKELMDNYDLGDDDLFECERCRYVSDIDDSTKVEGGLICLPCKNHLK